MTGKIKSIIEVEKLSNQYEGRPLLQEVSFSLDKGDILCLLGPSGSGKTTLLRLIAGLEQPGSGIIRFKGRDMESVASHNRNFGMMFQEYALFPHKNVQQNVSFGLEMQNCPPEELKRKVAEVLRLVGLTGFEQRNIDELSGGERQRVALARSLAPEPQLLLLDEPLGSLDRALRDRLTGEIREILKSLGVTAIFVTHDQTEAFSVADKVAVLDDGVLQQLDTPQILYRYPKNRAVARFLGFTNLVDGTLDGKGMFQAPFGPIRIDNKGSRSPGPATLLIRPEGAVVMEQGPNSEEGTRVSGTVRFRQFQGSRYRLSIDIAGTPLCFDLPIDPEPPATGQPLSLLLSSSALVILEE